MGNFSKKPFSDIYIPHSELNCFFAVLGSLKNMVGLRYLAIPLLVTILSADPIIAAIVSSPAAKPVKMLTQRFLTESASVVSIGIMHSCRAFRAIDIRASSYVSPTGQDVAFSKVERSPAAGLWVIGAADQKPGSTKTQSGTLREEQVWRVVLKYSVESLELEIDGIRKDLTEYLDDAGDSITLSAEDRAKLQLTWKDNGTVTLFGRSIDTGREVIDTLLPILERDLRACDKFEEGNSAEILPKANDEPFLESSVVLATSLWRIDAGAGDIKLDVLDPNQTVRTEMLELFPRRLGNNGPISVRWSDRLPGAPDSARLTDCRMTDLGGEIERYRVAQVDGFVTQSGEAWITRDHAGDVRQVYIPGVFEALRSPSKKEWVADVSIAAFANNPFERPVYKGCLGSQAITMVGGLDTVSEAPFSETIATVLDEGAEFSLSNAFHSFKPFKVGSQGYGEWQSGGSTIIGGLMSGNTKHPIKTEVNDVGGGGAGFEPPRPPSPVPIPSTIWLYLTLVLSLGLIACRRTTFSKFEIKG